MHSRGRDSGAASSQCCWRHRFPSDRARASWRAEPAPVRRCSVLPRGSPIASCGHRARPPARVTGPTERGGQPPAWPALHRGRHGGAAGHGRVRSWVRQSPLSLPGRHRFARRRRATAKRGHAGLVQLWATALAQRLRPRGTLTFILPAPFCRPAPRRSPPLAVHRSRCCRYGRRPGARRSSCCCAA